MFRLVALLILLFSFKFSFAQPDSTKAAPKYDYQIFLKQPGRQIKLLMYEKNFLPIQGTLSEDRKSIIMKDYDSVSKVHVKIVYEDGTEEDFVKSPCFIDPVIL